MYANESVLMTGPLHAGSENPGEGAHSIMVGIICPLVEIGLTVWPKTRLQQP